MLEGSDEKAKSSTVFSRYLVLRYPDISLGHFHARQFASQALCKIIGMLVEPDNEVDLETQLH